MLGSITHELKTPLNSIIQGNEILEAVCSTSLQMKCINTSKRSCKLLMSLIEDILDFTKLESGKFALRLSKVDIRKLIEETVELLTP